MWEKFSKLNREKLFIVKNELHTAIQLVSIPPRYYLPPAGEDQNAGLQWDVKNKSFVSQYFGHLNNLQTSLNIHNFELEIRVEEIVFDTINMDNRTFEYLFDWLSNKLKRLQLDPEKLSLKLPYQLEEIEIFPDSKINNYDPAALKEFSKYYQNAHYSFKKFKSENFKKKPKTTIWPHHFDLAITYSLSENSLKNFTMGLSPGDQFYPEPYFYLSFPEDLRAEIMNSYTPIVGNWHTKSWYGLVLVASEFVLETEHLQEQIIIDFLKNAYDISTKVFS